MVTHKPASTGSAEWVHTAVVSSWIHAIDIYMFNVPISSDDGNFRMQFNFCGKLQPNFLIFDFSINKINECSFQRKWAWTFCSCLQHLYFSKWSGIFQLVFLHPTSHSPHPFSRLKMTSDRDRELDQTAPSIWFLCSSVISELFMRLTEQEICIFL